MSQIWLITGSSRGLGRAFTETVLTAGHKVVAGAQNISQVADLRARFGERILPLSLDVTDELQAKAAVDFAIAHLGALDVLVNNAGYGNVSSVEETSIEEFRAQIETNLFGAIIMTKAVLPYFRERGAGRIIQITRLLDGSALLVVLPTPRRTLVSRDSRSRSQKRSLPWESA